MALPEKDFLKKLKKMDFSEKELLSLNKRSLFRVLRKFPVTNVKFGRKRISFTYLGQKISDKILVEWVPHVGEWSRKRKEVIIDSLIEKKHFKKHFHSLCVHEAVEKFIAQKFHLNTDKEAHPIAKFKEKQYMKSIGGNWRSHEMIVYWDWKKRGEH
ncbi:MAG: hypothetical protein ABIA76_01785 [Candidatus Diapherotrites archaeon]